MSLEAKYAIVWFENDEPYTLVDSDTDKPILLTAGEAQTEAASRILTLEQAEDMQEGFRYAVHTSLLDELFGYVV